MTGFPSSPIEFLTPEESAEVDKALLSSREKFSTRVAIYSLRSLKQISQEQNIPISDVTQDQVLELVEREQQQTTPVGLETDDSFKHFFTHLVMSSLRPLHRIAQETQTPLEELTLEQVIAWFEQEAKRRIEQGNDPASPT